MNIFDEALRTGIEELLADKTRDELRAAIVRSTLAMSRRELEMVLGFVCGMAGRVGVGGGGAELILQRMRQLVAPVDAGDIH